MRTTAAFALLIALVGCSSTNETRIYPGTERLVREGLPNQTVTLKTDVVFHAKPNWGRARTYKLPQGAYVFHGKDSQGRFFKHTSLGFYFDDHGPLPGGFFVPFDDSKPWGLWCTGVSRAQGAAIFGELGAAFGSSDPESNVAYILDLPAGAVNELRPYLEK